MTKAPPDISFIMAAYNAAETLSKAIDSALAQTGVTVEVIVADDCSTDETGEVARGYADKNVRLLTLEKNGGPAVARNTALAAASGRWIAVLDSDDAIEPGRLARLIARAEHAGAQIAVDNLRVIRADGSPPETMFAESALAAMPELTLPDFIRSNALFETTHNFGYLKPVFERAFIEKHALRFDENLRIGEDYVFLASALALGARCVIEPIPGYNYNIREGSISRVLELRHIEAMVEGDRVFLGKHTLDADAMAAQKFRAQSLRRAASFLILVENIKNRSISGAIRAAWRDPAALRHLKMPIAARLNRMAAAFRNLAGQKTDIPTFGGAPRSPKG
ncbi:glycosyltransferase family 2 protein [Rhizobium sp. P32RR-XVIII]|uniref:glycosyltransferase family 2 protein n=1 Tax=Rhizobium sp. P32RR-XVIII TaxID=2726738 RepID=UPI0014576906|nr:glycosyltransferase family 2 protein [Rhizobium sp. P32RR-XVIII]NLS06445.1 glycosyltransferase family 2 protein [Rhizobium sp. P32RR-XVIII]